MAPIIIGVLIFLVVIILTVRFFYNNLVRGRNRVDQSESDIDVQFKRRRELIPNLINAVKGYMKHEKETLTKIVQMRSEAMNAQPNTAEARQAENILGDALKSLFALAEGYPDLKASQNFIQLQEELVDTEDKIQAARRLYNSTLVAYINLLQTFPSNIFAKIFGFKNNRDYFEAEEAEREVVKVDF